LKLTPDWYSADFTAAVAERIHGCTGKELPIMVNTFVFESLVANRILAGTEKPLEVLEIP
jgi:hypothetical protein